MKMASALPPASSNRNGMIGVVDKLIKTPDEPIVCIVIVDSSQTLEDHYKHTKTPTISITHIEPMIEPGMRQRVLETLQQAYRNRTTEQLELPLFEDDPRMLDLAGNVLDEIEQQRKRNEALGMRGWEGDPGA